LLRAAGLELVTLAEHYGMPADENVDDVTWLADTAGFGWVVLMKDERIRRRPAEKATGKRHHARCFCITRGDLTGEAMAERVLRNLAAITDACAQPGPVIYAVQTSRIERLRI